MIHLQISDDLAQDIRNEAETRGLPVEEFLRLVVEHERTGVAQRARNAAAIKLLRTWRAGDEAHQCETWEQLKADLDRDRLSYRQLFS